MATINSFELAEFGNWLRYRFEITLSGGETLTGYDAWYSDTTSTPDWGDSVDCGTVGQNPLDVNQFEAMIKLSSDDVYYGETFQEYDEGDAIDMNKGGNLWDGSWNVAADKNVFYDFINYDEGFVVSDTLGGGFGWITKWIVKGL